MTEIKKNGRLCIFPSAFDSKETVRRVERELEKRKIPVFAKFDHEKNAQEAGLLLRPTEVLVFGSPEAGTKLMQKKQSFAIEPADVHMGGRERQGMACVPPYVVHCGNI